MRHAAEPERIKAPGASPTDHDQVRVHLISGGEKHRSRGSRQLTVALSALGGAPRRGRFGEERDYLAAGGGSHRRRPRSGGGSAGRTIVTHE
jgi:hypothetical protein